MPFIAISSSSVRPSDRPWEAETFPTPADAEQFADECYAGYHVRNLRRERAREQARLGDFFPKLPAPRRKRPKLSARQGEVLQAIAAEIARELESLLYQTPPYRSPEEIARCALDATGVRLGVPRALALLQGACLSLWETGALRAFGIIVPAPVTSPADVVARVGSALNWPDLPVLVGT